MKMWFYLVTWLVTNTYVTLYNSCKIFLHSTICCHIFIYGGIHKERSPRAENISMLRSIKSKNTCSHPKKSERYFSFRDLFNRQRFSFWTRSGAIFWPRCTKLCMFKIMRLFLRRESICLYNIT